MKSSIVVFAVLALLFVSKAAALTVEGEEEDDSMGIPQAKEPVELTSATFEDKTQAGGGMTTGSWFVMFYAPWCPHCQRLTPVWEKLAAAYGKHHVNIAKVNCDDNNDVCRRFNVKGYPTVITFHKQKMYTYTGSRETSALLTYLAGTVPGLKDGATIPQPLTWSDELKFWYGMVYEAFADVYEKNPEYLAIGVIVIILVAVLMQWVIIKLIPLPEQQPARRQAPPANAPAAAAQAAKKKQ